MESLGVGLGFNEGWICQGSSKDACAISRLSAGASPLGPPPIVGLPSWWDSWKVLHGILHCKYIHIARKKWAGKHRKSKHIKHKRHQELPTITGAAGLSPYIKKMDSAAFLRAPQWLGTSICNYSARSLQMHQVSLLINFPVNTSMSVMGLKDKSCKKRWGRAAIDVSRPPQQLRYMCHPSQQ